LFAHVAYFNDLVTYPVWLPRKIRTRFQLQQCIAYTDFVTCCVCYV